MERIAQIASIESTPAMPSEAGTTENRWLSIKELVDIAGPKHDNFNDVVEEAIGFVATTWRYVLTAFPMAKRAREGKSIAVIGTATVLADVWDGKVQRGASKMLLGREAEDTPFRRILDGLFDQATVLQVGYEVAKRNPTARPYLGGLALRSAIAGGGMNGVHLAATGEVTKGRNWQRATNTTAAIFGIAAASGNKVATHVSGIVANAVAWGTAPVHLRDFRKRKNQVFREL